MLEAEQEDLTALMPVGMADEFRLRFRLLPEKYCRFMLDLPERIRKRVIREYMAVVALCFLMSPAELQEREEEQQTFDVHLIT
jgi:hypothetical protein